MAKHDSSDPIRIHRELCLLLNQCLLVSTNSFKNEVFDILYPDNLLKHQIITIIALSINEHFTSKEAGDDFDDIGRWLEEVFQHVYNDIEEICLDVVEEENKLKAVIDLNDKIIRKQIFIRNVLSDLISDGEEISWKFSNRNANTYTSFSTHKKRKKD